MPLLRPMTHTGSRVLLAPDDVYNCAACPDAWFRMNFDTMYDGGTQGCYVQLDDGSYRWLPIDGFRVREDFPPERVFEVGRDGYYLTLAQARDAIDQGVHGVHYVDDFDDEYQDVYVCDPVLFPHNIPGDEAHRPEPIR